MNRRRLPLIALACVAIGCASGSGSGGCAIGFGIETENRAEIERFETLRDRFFVRHLLFNPVTATYLGADGYSNVLQSTNGALKDYSEAALARELAFYRESHQELQAIALDHLPPNHRVDHRVMDAQLKFLVRLIGERKYHQRAVDTYTTEPFRGVDWQVQQMQDVGSGLRGTEAEWTLLVSRVEAIPGYLDRARANLLAGKEAGNVPDWRMVQRNGVEASVASVEYFRRTLGETATGLIGNRPFGQKVMPSLHQAGDRAATAWDEFAKFLQATYQAGLKPCATDTGGASGVSSGSAAGVSSGSASGVSSGSAGLQPCPDRYAAGTEEYEWRVRNIFGDTRSAEELYEYGAQQVALYSRLIDEVVAIIAKEAGLGAATTRDVVNHLANDSPGNDDELFTWYRETAARAVAYGREHQMFDVPADYTLDILPTPPVLRNSIDAAYYMAPPFKKSGVGRFYLTPTGNDPAKLRLKKRASIADTAIHEGFPGHDWHFKYMTQYANQIPNVRWLTPGAVEDSSSMWSDSLAAEGWGLYAEELMAEPVANRPYGFYSAPEYLYELQGQMTRAVRVRVDVGIHTGRMTFDQARDYYVEHAEFYPGACGLTDPDARAACDAAERAIYRYSKWPTQAIAYNLGKNAIIALREEVKKNMGTAYSPRAFHERFMRMGAVPVVFFRDAFR
jgi:uncharacterized protein (DUF885 family)